MALQQSHYEILVSQNGKFLFATDARSAVDTAPAKALVKLFREKFPEAEGYKVTCQHVQCAGKKMEF